MRARLLRCAIQYLLLASMPWAAEPGNRDLVCSLESGSAGLRIDGFLQDWGVRALAQPLRWSRSVSGEPPDNSSATIRCFADRQFFYLGVDVIAAPLRFETMPFNQAWRTDSIEVFLSNYGRGAPAHVRSGLIRVSLDSAGRVVTEGWASITDGARTTQRMSYPSLWEAVGIKTGLRMAPAGYSVEIAIPRDSMGQAEVVAAAELSMNIRVRRSCGIKPCQAVLELSDDPYNSSPADDERYRRVSFGLRRGAMTGSAVLGPEGEDSVSPLIYRALLQMDAFNPSAGVAILRQSQDRRLLPVLANAFMAAGDLYSAVSVLGSVGDESGDATRFWAMEQIARAHVLQGAPSLAAREYGALATFSNPAVQDIGVAGLIDLAISDGKDEAVMATYQAAYDESPEIGMRSASRIVDWLQRHGRVQDAIDILTRASESALAHDSERAWALLQLQSLYQWTGDPDNAATTGWRLQAIAPPGDPAGEAGLKRLIAGATFGRVASAGAVAFSDSYRRFLDANPEATDPARRIVHATALGWEGKLSEAAGIYEGVVRESSAGRKDRAAALLSLQRLHVDSGRLERSVEVGLMITDVFPQDLGSRLASWQLMRLAGEASGMPTSLRRRVEDFGRSLANDILRKRRHSTDASQTRAQALLLQFEKELNLR